MFSPSASRQEDHEATIHDLHAKIGELTAERDCHRRRLPEDASLLAGDTCLERGLGYQTPKPTAGPGPA